MKRIFTIVFFMCLFSPYLFAGGESESTTQKESGPSKYKVYEGPIVSSYPGPHIIRGQSHTVSSPGMFYVVDTDGDLSTTQDRKRLWVGDEQEHKYQLKEGDVVEFLWKEVNDSLGYSLTELDLLKINNRSVR